MLTIWNILESLYRRKYLILAVVLVFALIGTYYVNSNQSYSAEMIIKYTSPNAPHGLTETDAPLNVHEILSPNVLESALEDVNYRMGVDTLRKCISITPIIPQDEADLKEAKIKGMQSYTYNPVYYSVRCTMGQGFPNVSGELARDILDAVMNRYFIYYGEKYLTQDSLANVDLDTVAGAHDYLEIAEIIDGNITDIQDYLANGSSNAPGFRSATTGLSFNDLREQYTLLKNIDLSILYSDILTSRITENQEVLSKKYLYKIDTLNQDSASSHNESVVSYELMQKYSQKNVAFLWRNTNDETNASQVTEVIDNLRHRNSVATYDILVDDYVDDVVDARNALIDVNYCNYILNAYNGTNVTGNLVTAEQVTKETETLNQKMATLFEKTQATVNDYNQYSAMQGIATISGISINENLSSRLYLMVAIVAGVGIGVVTVVALELLQHIFRKKDEETPEEPDTTTE